jgi:hypothetical protein
LLAWAQAVCDRWQARVDAGERPPFGDDFAFWAAEYDRDFGAAAESARGPGADVMDADQTQRYLANLRSFAR